MNAKTSPRAHCDPDTFRRRAVTGLVAIDQAKARLALVAVDVKSDSAAVSQLRVSTRTHRLARIRILLALKE
jgi:hypothetical protein